LLVVSAEFRLRKEEHWVKKDIYHKTFAPNLHDDTDNCFDQ